MDPSNPQAAAMLDPNAAQRPGTPTQAEPQAQIQAPAKNLQELALKKKQAVLNSIQNAQAGFQAKQPRTITPAPAPQIQKNPNEFDGYNSQTWADHVNKTVMTPEDRATMNQMAAVKPTY